MARKKLMMLAVRLEPGLHRRVRVRVAKLGRPWTISKLASEALILYLQSRRTAS